MSKSAQTPRPMFFQDLKRARIYCRVSSEDQQEKETIENQEIYATKYCDLYEIDIIDWYKDDGVSGTIPMSERPEGKRLLDDIMADPEPCLVLAFNVRRLGRDARHILNAVHELESTGKVAVRSMTEAFDTGTPAGRFFLTILAGVAGYDRETLLENMRLGAYRHAMKGRWLGGIVPYGYRVDDEGFLEINEDPLPDLAMSEADVIRLMYKLVAEDGCSTIEVADYFNALGIPPSYVKDGRKVRKGKRKERTAGIWRPGRIRNMLVNPTYKGLHIYGKRTNKPRELISRNVQAIVSEEVWDKAQKVLRNNQILSKKNAKRDYLLTGLIKCNVCGSNYHGMTYPGTKKKKELSYYKCNGKTAYRGPLQGRCNSKNIPRQWLEDLIWNDCVDFIKNPGEALKELAASMEKRKSQKTSLETERSAIQKSIYEKELEKESILDLYRKKLIGHGDVEKQLLKISREKEALQRRMQELQQQIDAETILEKQFDTAGELLATLREKIKEDPQVEVKKEIVRTLVDSITVITIQEEDKPSRAEVLIKYRFMKVVNRTDKRAENNLYLYVEKRVPLAQYNCTLPETDNQGARVRKARLAKSLTIRALAEASGLTPETISYIENGKNPASLSTLRALSEALEVSICYLGCFESLPEDTLGQKIRKGRFCAGLTIEELAKTIGVDPGTLNKWENDKHKPLKRYLDKLKKHIEI